MVRKTKNRAAAKNGDAPDTRRAWHEDLHGETKRGILAILFFIAAVLFALSYVGKGGSAGSALYRLFSYLLGGGYFFAPITLVLVAFSLFRSRERKIVGATVFGGTLFLLMILAAFHILAGAGSGGLIGRLIGGSLLSLFDIWASMVIIIGLLIISFIVMLNIPLWRKKDEEEESSEESGMEDEKARTLLENVKALLQKGGNESETISTAIPVVDQREPERSTKHERDETQEEAAIALRKIVRNSQYKRPPLELLQGDRGKPLSGDIKANANIIKRTLENFGIDVEMGEVSIGPTVTQYTLRPAEGIKLSRITALHNDLSLALAAHPIRIEAPIPGKPLVGIEVPNRSIALVGLRALLEVKTFQEAGPPLLFALGRDVAGSPVFADLARMPHLLVSGATGAGKSVTIHSIIASFLYRNPPEVLRFILIDPKRVELSAYNDVPHLLTPVITEAKKTIQSLRWAAREMDRRYDLLSRNKARDITSYNALAGSGAHDDFELLPYIVIMIDELADLMAVYPREMEGAIIRLAQMARAVGIHLIVATQRPSVEVITGLIKANITSRIALQVASQIDSRTILDISGAEKLLGNGDMLFLAGDTAKPRRIQGAYVSDQEVKRVIDFLREEVEAPEHNEGILETEVESDGERGGAPDGDDDPLYGEAQEIITQAGKASASYLQRRLRVGYARAARLLDLLESRGVIGPADGAKPREVFAKSGSGIEMSDLDDDISDA